MPVAVEPGTTRRCSADWGGLSSSPGCRLAGALLLAAVVVAGGLRMRRTAWTLAGIGAALIGAAFLTL